ncbi:phage portal protein [Geopsychrobacter electrodiphilus]|uniref:phage portal protein n=1 Tax=Geopsychrobacter electrodiphilus TaxID=225196 RepID=UPI00036E86F2|nr:phage portal protein [Geopsychrobacter electrodiphilus]
MKPVTLRMRGREVTVKPNIIDHIAMAIAPGYAVRRFKDKMTMAALGGYTGGRRNKKQTKNWATAGGDADSDTLFDLPTLRERSRDLIRNEPIATGAAGTMVTNVIGSGLRLKPAIDHEYLGITEEEANLLEKKIKREWLLWSQSTYCDIERTLNFSELQALAFRQTFENGDSFALLPEVDRKGNFPYRLAVQLIEADRVCNRDNNLDSEQLSGGVNKDANGAPKSYDVLKRHPGCTFGGYKKEWYAEIPAFGNRTQRRNILHVYRKLRPGQSRGVPDIAPIIQPLKQLSQLTEAELDAAVSSALISVFVKSSTGEAPDWNDFIDSQSGVARRDVSDIDLESSAVVGLLPDEDVVFNDPNRPNGKFDPFWLALVRQIGMALEIPFEILVKHFSSSYSASRGAMLEAWRMFSTRRKWFASRFCQPIYEVFFDEMVATGRFYAPGYFADPMVRKAWSGGEWVGDPRGMIKETEEIDAATKRVALGISTREKETEQLTGGDFETNHRQLAREQKMRVDAGLIDPIVSVSTAQVVADTGD